MEDDHGPPRFARAGQNIAAAAALLQGLPAPATPEERKTQQEIKTLLERAAAQQAESSLSRRRGRDAPTRAGDRRRAGESTVDQPQRQDEPADRPPVQQRIGPVNDARVILDVRRWERDNWADGAALGYHVRRGGRFDPEEDRSPSPPPAGPHAFCRRILGTPFPPRYRAPNNIAKYSGETNPSLWLEDYRLACLAGGADNDDFII